jgi:hypothetical protein
LRLLVNVAIFVLAELLFADLALTGFVTRARARRSRAAGRIRPELGLPPIFRFDWIDGGGV